jgi:hypothetical protein
VTPATDATPPAKSKRKQSAAEPKVTKVSAIDAAAKVLAESGEAMTTKAMIEQMAKKGYWSSPGGQTPAPTLYCAILPEISTKGDTARFVKRIAKPIAADSHVGRRYRNCLSTEGQGECQGQQTQ